MLSKSGRVFPVININLTALFLGFLYPRIYKVPVILTVGRCILKSDNEHYRIETSICFPFMTPSHYIFQFIQRELAATSLLFSSSRLVQYHSDNRLYLRQDYLKRILQLLEKIILNTSLDTVFLYRKTRC